MFKIEPMRIASKDIRNILADNIRCYRHQMNLSQENLADRCGLHRTYIGSVERGERNVTLSTLEVLASALKTTAPKLLSKMSEKFE
jgi:transcriptional regulator with XRE-family HTH domain